MSEIVFKSATTLITNIYIFIWMKQIYENKYKNIWIYILSCLGITGIGIAVSTLNIPLGNLLYTISSIALTSVFLYKGSVKTKIIFDVLYFFLLFMLDVLAVWIWVVIDGKRLDLVLSDEIRMCISYIFNWVVMTIMWWIFMIFISKEKALKIKIRELILQLIYTVFAFFVLYGYIEKADDSEDGIILISIIIGFVIIDVILIVIMKSVSDAYKIGYQLDVMKYQNELQLEHYKELSDRYEESRKIIHDAKKHISVIENMNDSNECKEYSKKVRSQMDLLAPEFACSNRIIAAILSAKTYECEQLKIRMNIDVADGLYDYIDEIDLTGILANIWDNAIEASKLLDEKERHIDFIMGERNGFCIIGMKNNYDSKLVKPKDKHMGLGRKIVKKIANEYKGMFDEICDNNIYETRIMLSINN